VTTPLAPSEHDELPAENTFAEMRDSGVRDALIYCRDDWLPNCRTTGVRPATPRRNISSRNASTASGRYSVRTGGGSEKSEEGVIRLMSWFASRR
jgi:hypothetical protein